MPLPPPPPPTHTYMSDDCMICLSCLMRYWGEDEGWSPSSESLERLHHLAEQRATERKRDDIYLGIEGDIYPGIEGDIYPLG